MKRAAPLLLALLAAAGCQRKVDVVPADAAAEAQARTSAKALADIAAAEEAARTPLPASARRDAPAVEEREARATGPSEDIGEADVPLNETTPR